MGVEGTHVRVSERSARRARGIVYTPSLGGGWVLGNGSLDFEWDSTRIRGAFTIGSTTTKGASPLTFSIPAPVTRTAWATGTGVDTSSGVVFPLMVRSEGSAITPFALASVSQMNNSGITSAIPITWATGDSITFTVDVFF